MIEPNNYAVYKYDNDNKSCCLVRIDDIVNDERGVVKITVIKVFKDDSGNGFFNYLEETGKQMNASTKYLHPIDSLLARLAAYEDTGLSPEEIKLNMDGLDKYHKAEAEGRLTVLPCKVGDTVWTLNHHFRPVDGKVQSIHQNYVGGWAIRWVLTSFFPEYYGQAESGLNPDFLSTRKYFEVEDFGKSVFLSREEAEKALEALAQ